MGALTLKSWSWLLRSLILPAGDLAFGQGLMKRLKFLEEAQWWDREYLLDYRDRALNQLVRTAYEEVPVYRNLMTKAGVVPDDVRHRDDLWKLPVVSKSVLRPAYPHLTTRNTGQRSYEVSSSGSTGTNFRVLEDPETAGLHRAAFMLALQWAGWRIGEPHVQTGITPKRSADRKLKDTLLRCHYVSAFDLNDAHLDATLDVLDRGGVQHLWGYPGSLHYIAQRASERGWNRPLRSIVTWGDNLYAHYREPIEKVFQARIFDTYGCGEGIQIAAQCGRANTYHVHSPDVIVECVDQNGNAVKAGEVGNLIVTRLHAGPMPLIRYQVGDLGVTGGTRICECGRGYEILESVQGRDTDVVVTPSGNRLIVHFFTGILEHFREIDSFQVVQEDTESILVRVVPAKDFSNETAHRIISALRDRGADLRIEVEPVTKIPPSPSGKRRFVVAKPFKSQAQLRKD